MFAEWVTHGAEIGTVAFIAVVVFVILCGAVLGLVGLLAKVLEVDNGKDRSRPL